eukprot:2697024-Prymnesium_polylepis.1
MLRSRSISHGDSSHIVQVAPSACAARPRPTRSPPLPHRGATGSVPTLLVAGPLSHSRLPARRSNPRHRLHRILTAVLRVRHT